MLKAVRHVVVSAFLVGCAVPQPPQVNPTPLDSGPERLRAGSGVLVMAHGGSHTWNAAVEEAVAPVAAEIPTAIAFGMADPKTLQAAIDRLESAGVERIAVIRLFISGSSFLKRTEYLFHQRSDLGGPASPHAARDPLPRIRTSSDVVIDRLGLVDAPETGRILLDRANALSRDASSEAVLLLGHGNGEESVNSRLLESMDLHADGLRASDYEDVEVETLREDWATDRERAEVRIRAWISRRSNAGVRVLVIPFRLFGFGPYTEVLEGVDYEADGLGLLPHPEITNWLRRRIGTIACDNGWTQRPCPSPTEGGGT